MQMAFGIVEGTIIECSGWRVAFRAASVVETALGTRTRLQDESSPAHHRDRTSSKTRHGSVVLQPVSSQQRRNSGLHSFVSSSSSLQSSLHVASPACDVLNVSDTTGGVFGIDQSLDH